MPSYNPPLASETHIPISSSDANRFVHLHFTLSFEPTEDASGTWELWTDIADVNPDGQVVTQPGEWRSVDFIPSSKQLIIPNGHGHGSHDDYDATDESGTTIKLVSTPIIPSTPPACTELVADMIVPAHNTSYAYTYRRVTTSGETHWLGNGSDNGVVRVFEGEKIPPQPQVVEWEGVGIELLENGGAPIHHHLPSGHSTHASILLLRSTAPLVQPTHRLADTPVKLNGSDRSSSVILSNELKPVPVAAKATSPLASGVKLYTDEHQSVAALFKDACRDQTLIRPTFDDEDDEVVSFIYSPANTPKSTYLVVYAPRLTETRVIQRSLPGVDSDKVPVAIYTDADGKYRYVDADKVSEVRFQLPAGKIASVVSVARFTGLEHQDETVWIAGVGASNQEIKEEETPQSTNESKETVKPRQIEHVEVAPNSSKSSIAESETASIDSERSVIRKVEPSSFLQLLRKFFFSLWSWLFTPFGFGKAQPRTGETVNDDASSVASSTGLLTPHERTPLLDSPDSSHGTSSTAVSPLNIPKTGGTAMLKTLSDSSATTENSTVAAPLIRKYAQFTFERAPLHLLFAPGFGSRIHQGLLFRSRRSGEKDWSRHDVQPTKGEEGCCDEVFVEQEQAQAGPWEVQVEFQ